ncbi:MAG: hypothetical protein EXR75_02405 [Myxococcales bacterium]|nr:hypothetical protein [Myxococcales bacterium]
MAKRSRKQRKDDAQHPARMPRPTHDHGEQHVLAAAAARAREGADAEERDERPSARGARRSEGEGEGRVSAAPPPWRRAERLARNRKTDRSVLLIFAGLAISAALFIWWGTRPTP